MADKSLFPPSAVRTIEDIARQQVARLTAADALAEKAEQLLEFIREHIATANDLHEVFELDAALREYREATE